MVGSVQATGASALAGVLLALGTISCQFPGYHVGADSSDKGGVSAGGVATIAGGGGSAGTAGAAGMATGGVAGQGDNFPEPVGMTLGAETGKAFFGASAGGAAGDAFADACPVNQVLVGLEGTTGNPKDVVHSVSGRCGEVSVEKRADGGGYDVHINPNVLLPERGEPTPTVQVANCPTDQAMTGFSGRAGSVIDAIQIRCASFRIVGSAPSFELLVYGEGSAGWIGGLGGPTFDVTECPPNELAFGQYVRVGGLPSGFGVLCAVPSLALE